MTRTESKPTRSREIAERLRNGERKADLAREYFNAGGPMTALSTDARETLDELGITVHDVRDGLVEMGDPSGPYDPAPLATVEAACAAVNAFIFRDDADRSASAYRFEAFHDALAAEVAR